LVTAKAALRFITVGFGPAVRDPAWPLSGLVVAGLLAVGISCLAAAVRRQSADRRACSLGLSIYLVACLAIALATGHARAPLGHWYLFGSRYAAASVPTLLGLYFVWEFTGPRAVKTLGRMVLFSLAVTALSRNWAIGMEEFTRRSVDQRNFERDVKAGVPIPRLISLYGSKICEFRSVLEYSLKSLRDARVGDYRNLPPDPTFREVPLALVPVDSHNVQWQGRASRGTGPQPYVTYRLGEPTFLAGLRIKYSCANAEGIHPWLQVTWRNSRHEPFIERGGVQPRRFIDWLVPIGEDVVIPIWVYGTVDEIRIYPDKRPCEFAISEITLLLPETAAPPVAAAANTWR
jgi:hypothetical protein